VDVSQFFTTSATVETFTGSGPNGALYAAPVTVMGFLDDGVIRDETGSTVQLVSQSKFYCQLADAPKLTVDSRLTVNGRVCYVSKMRRRDADGFDGPSHTETDLR
jgi:hypothetical protein